MVLVKHLNGILLGFFVQTYYRSLICIATSWKQRRCPSTGVAYNGLLLSREKGPQLIQGNNIKNPQNVMLKVKEARHKIHTI